MSSVLFKEYFIPDGRKIVEIFLNAEGSLNALSLEMIDLIQDRLDVCVKDEAVLALIINSAGQKAFCAGGDVVNLYKAIQGEVSPSFPEDFFTREYLLDYTIHTYPKPIICWASGLVMGGGMGLMNGCSHRIVTETSQLSMPEVTLGLYPDVGASWFLNHMPGRTGLFLGLTGNPINASDALFVGLADRFIRSQSYELLISSLLTEHWDQDPNIPINRVLRELENDSKQHMDDISLVKRHFEFIQEVTDKDNLAEVVAAIIAEPTDDKWINRAQKGILQGSPLAMHIVKQQLSIVRHMSLKQVFMSELILSVQCCQHREFPEGIRALLIDKDRDPDWTYKNINDVEECCLAEFFISPWPHNPLENL